MAATTSAAQGSGADRADAQRGDDAGTRRHRVGLEVIPPVPAEVPVGTSVSFKVRVSCGDADLRGACIEVVASEQVVAAPRLVEPADGASETATIAIRAPSALGAYGLGIVFPRQQIGRDIYEETTLPIAFRAVPHKTSLAVWGVSSPVRSGGSFSVTVGVKSAGGCDLRRARVEIQDETGAAIGHGLLGEAPWPGTGLYWANISLTAPATVRTFSWRAAFPAQELKLAHDESSAAFGFTTVPPPDHRLTVKVTEGGGAEPMAGVALALGPYRAATDAAGLASLEVPAGRFSLAVWKSGFEAGPIDVEVDRALHLEVEMARLPQEPTVWD
jgi:hypothetical protein